MVKSRTDICSIFENISFQISATHVQPNVYLRLVSCMATILKGCWVPCQMIYDFLSSQGDSLDDLDGKDVYVAVTFGSIEEARRRAILLLALTWRPLRRHGARIVPVAMTSFGKTLLKTVAKQEILEDEVSVFHANIIKTVSH